MAAGRSPNDQEVGTMQEGRLPVEMLGPKAAAVLQKLGVDGITQQLMPHLQLLEACQKPGAQACEAVKYLLNSTSYHDAAGRVQSVRLRLRGSWILFLMLSCPLTPEVCTEAKSCCWSIYCCPIA